MYDAWSSTPDATTTDAAHDGSSPRAHTLYALDALLKKTSVPTCEKPDAADELAAMQARGVRADLHCYNSLIAGYAARGKAAEADALLKSMARDGIAPDQWTYGPLLEACRRAGNRQRAARYGERVFKELTPPPSFCVTSLGRSLGAGGLAALAKRCGVDPATLPPPRPAGERRRGK